jgi:quercetin dioxygenase-like cupin family protein
VAGPGCSAFIPPNVKHDIVAVGDETLVATVATCLLDDDKLFEND